MFSENSGLANFIAENSDRIASGFSPPAIAGGAFMSGEDPFDFYLESRGYVNISGDRWSGDDTGRMIFERGYELDIHARVEAGESLVIVIKAEILDGELLWGSQGFSSGGGEIDKPCIYYNGTKDYRIISPQSDGTVPMPKISIYPSPDQGSSDWELKRIEIYKFIR